MKTLLKIGILVLIACYFSACSKPSDKIVQLPGLTITQPADPMAPPAAPNCHINPEIMNQNFAPPGQDINLTYDASYTTGVDSGPVAPGDMRFVETDYGCFWDFYSFQLRNQITNVWAFGTVTIYAKSFFLDPWTLLGTYDEAAASPFDGYNWGKHFYIQAKFIRYEFKNNTAAPIDFVITDIESGAEYINDNP